MSKALVIFSGGQDSVTCLGVAIEQMAEVEAISFMYGQQHQIEIAQASMICSKLEIKHTIIDLTFFGRLVTSALTGEGSVNDAHPDNPDLPASFVPNRNALFLTVAHAHAQEIGADIIYTGTCQTDYSGYPDCRQVFIRSMNHSLNIGSDSNICVLTPLMHLTKAETFKLAEDVGILDIVIKDSHTCYNGDRDTEWDWGKGCGECPACELRANGYAEYIKAKELLS